MDIFSAGPSAGYTLPFATDGNFSPADSTTYYFGEYVTTSATAAPIWLPRAGTVKAVYMSVVVGGTLGTTETSTLSFRLNNTTDTTITSVLTAAAARTDFSNSALAIAVAAGDYCSIKWVTPAWVTNPTTIILSGVIFVAI